jgi:succinate dehydrogenase hydrophobic anchor subunit
MKSEGLLRELTPGHLGSPRFSLQRYSGVIGVLLGLTPMAS